MGIYSAPFNKRSLNARYSDTVSSSTFSSSTLITKCSHTPGLGRTANPTHGGKTTTSCMFCTQLNTPCMLIIFFYCEQATASLQASSQRQRHADLVCGLLARSQDHQKANSRQYWKRNCAFQQSTSNLTSHQDERKRKVNGKQYLPVCTGIPKQEDPQRQLLHTRLWHHLDDLTTGEVGELTSHAPPTWTWRKFYQDAMEKQRFWISDHS